MCSSSTANGRRRSAQSDASPSRGTTFSDRFWAGQIRGVRGGNGVKGGFLGGQARLIDAPSDCPPLPCRARRRRSSGGASRSPAQQTRARCSLLPCEPAGQPAIGQHCTLHIAQYRVQYCATPCATLHVRRLASTARRRLTSSAQAPRDCGN